MLAVTKNPGALKTVQQSFYVDNYLESFPTTLEAKLHSLLALGEFDHHIYPRKQGPWLQNNGLGRTGLIQWSQLWAETQLIDHHESELVLLRECQFQSFPEVIAVHGIQQQSFSLKTLMSACCTQVQNDCMQKYGGNTGSCEDAKLLNTTSLSVHPVSDGELSLRYHRWQTCHQSGSGFSLHHSLRFGPYHVKIGRRIEKRWGVIFKCLTTRAVNSMDVDAFLLALRRFIARHGRPKEIKSDCGTNFCGAERELREAFAALESQLKEQLADYQILFKFNSPNAPHFGGAWEREVRSIKAALQVAIGSQSVSEDVLSTVLVEVEGILNSKPLGYVSADIVDLDTITPNLMKECVCFTGHVV